ncbi:MAG: hypothetical protein SPJ34_08375, partial [Candidatus Ornithospirochaeta sp.]|nr:hypothetical protein [Candidatus Ornithospirochaeta sp.]
LEFRRMISDQENKDERSAAEIEVECGVVGSEKVTRRLFVNGNTLFVGTMNEDETTQMLSDKVMDRSNMIRFGKPKHLETKPDIEAFGKYYSNKDGYISYGTWKGFRANSSLTYEKKLRDTVDKLLLEMDSVGRPFAHRVWQSIQEYVSLYPEANSQKGFSNALADQIEMKILPKLNGIELGSSDAVNKAFNNISEIIKGLDDEKLQKAFMKSINPENGAFFQWKGVVR